MLNCVQKSHDQRLETDVTKIQRLLETYRTNYDNSSEAALLKAALSEVSDTSSVPVLFDVASEFYAADRLANFARVNKKLLEFSVSVNDTASQAKAYRYMAEYYISTKHNDSAYQALKAAEKLYTRLNDSYNLGRVLYKKGILQYGGNDLLGADLSMTQAYNLLKNSGDPQVIYQTLSMTGIIAKSLEDYEKALEFHRKALNLVRESKLDRSLTQEESSLNNIGGVLQSMGQNRQAIVMFEEALKSQQNLKTNNLSLYALLLDNLAYSKFRIGNLDEVGKLLHTALKMRDSLGLKSYAIISRNHLSEYYATKNDTNRAIAYAKDALSIAREIKSPIDKLLALKQLSAVDRTGAAQYSQDYIRINDSLQQAERKSRDKFVRLELETEQIASENNKLAEQNRALLYFFIGTFMVGCLLFVIRVQRSKNRELLLKQAQQKANEEIYNLIISQQTAIEETRVQEKKRIAKELHDGVLGRLFGTRLNLDSLNKDNNPDTILRRSKYIAELKNIEQDIREISHDLNREKYVLINNFTAILNNFIEEQETSFNIRVEQIIDEQIPWDKVQNSYKINIYRIIQESFQNINKYADASEIRLSLKKQDNHLVISIIDNGRGFELRNKKKGIGLQNMLTRANEMGGTLDIRSKKGKGTTIIVTIPIT